MSTPAKTTLFAWPIRGRPQELAEGLNSAKIAEGNFRQ
jgi:hypothetical protein